MRRGKTHYFRQMDKIGGVAAGISRRWLGHDSALLHRGGGHRAVQQRSTATCLDSGGLLGTCRDGDLRRWTSVDGLPLDGMQEVWGSNPHSSTQRSSRFGEAYFRVWV